MTGTVMPGTVSICIPTCNRGSFLRESLDSIRRQNYPQLEIVISDNASSDNTESICRDAAQEDPRIRYIRQPQNLGIHGNHNFCLDESRGEFVCFFHDDDLYAPNIVSAYVSFMDEHPEVGVVCSDWELIDEQGTVIGQRRQGVPAVMPGMKFISRTIRSGRSSIACSGAMARRSALGTARFHDGALVGFEDFVLWFQIAERAAVGHIGTPLWRYRLHRSSLSRQSVRSVAQNYAQTLSRYCEDYLRRRPDDAATVREWRDAIDRFLFLALLYEVGLHFRANGRRRGGPQQTVFELADYRLSPAEFQTLLGELRAFKGSAGRRATLWIIEAMMRSQVTWPLAWMTQYTPAVRQILRLR